MGERGERRLFDRAKHCMRAQRLDVRTRTQHDMHRNVCGQLRASLVPLAGAFAALRSAGAFAFPATALPVLVELDLDLSRRPNQVGMLPRRNSLSNDFAVILDN